MNTGTRVVIPIASQPSNTEVLVMLFAKSNRLSNTTQDACKECGRVMGANTDCLLLAARCRSAIIVTDI